MTDLCLLYTNDTHSHLDSFSKRVHLLKTIRKENEEKSIPTFTFDSGDTYSGYVYFPLYNGQKEAEFLSYAGYDGMTFGNHDFDCGSQIVADFMKKINFPVISSNVNINNDHLLSPLTGKYDHGDYSHIGLVPFIIEDLGQGKKIGVFGLTTPTTSGSSTPSKETLFLDPYLVARDTVNYLEHLGVDRIVLISHLGVDEDEKLAQVVPEIDIIIGGHSHTLLDQPLVLGDLTNPQLIVQAGQYGQYVGRLDLSFDDDHLTFKNTLYNLKDYKEEDELIKEKLASMHEERAELVKQVIGKTNIFLDGELKHLQAGETNLGKLVANSLFFKARKEGYNPDLAMINGGGVRISIEAGDISLCDIINVLPFSKHLMVLEVTGADILKSLEYGLSPQLSHLEVKYDKSKPDGAKVLQANIIKDGELIPLDKDKIYKLATNSFVGLGKEEFKGFEGKDNLIDKNYKDIDILIEYIQSLNHPIDK